MFFFVRELAFYFFQVELGVDDSGVVFDSL